jgi:hypothetical protein
MLIPYSFKLGKGEYRVQHVLALPQCRVGYVHYPPVSLIQIAQTSWGACKLRARRRVHIFWHETVHAILHDMGHRLRDDEKFVDAFAKRLTQIVSTARVR